MDGLLYGFIASVVLSIVRVLVTACAEAQGDHGHRQSARPALVIGTSSAPDVAVEAIVREVLRHQHLAAGEACRRATRSCAVATIESGQPDRE